MRILYVLRAFPKLSETFVLNELHELSRRGHEVLVFAFEDPDEGITHEELDGLDIDVYYGEAVSGPSLSLLSPEVIHPAVLRVATRTRAPLQESSRLRTGKQLASAIDQGDGVDLIHSHFARPNRVAATYAAAYHGVPHVVTAHAYEIFADPNYELIREVCDLADHVITPSEYNRRYLREEVGVDNSVSVVPATTRVDKFRPPESDEEVTGRVLTVARLVEKKGIEFAIDAVGRLIEAGHDVEYHLVGTGKRHDALRKRIKAHGIADAVSFLGNVSDDRLRREFQEASVFVLPCVVAPNGDRDVMPVALKESMATATPCVSTAISGIPELIEDGHDGRLVPPNDAAAVAAAVESLLEDPHERRRLGDNARETIVADFDITSSVDALLEVFADIHEREAAT